MLVAWLLLSACEFPVERPERRVQLQRMETLPEMAIGEIDGVRIYAGGYSGLELGPEGKLWTLSDRGPNLDASARLGRAAKRFPFPDFHPGLMEIRIQSDSAVVLMPPEYLKDEKGRALKGLAPTDASSSHEVETALGRRFEKLPHDDRGIDSEGLCFGEDQHGKSLLFISEEYRPSIYMYEGIGSRLKARFTPAPIETWDRALPEILLQREPNLGFEGICYVKGMIYAALQSPLAPPGADPTTPMLRIIRIDPQTGQSATFIYALDGHERKVADLASLPDGQILVLEHGYPGRSKAWQVQVYAIDPARSTALDERQLAPERFADQVSALAGGVQVLPKKLYADLSAAGWPDSLRKPEGLAVMPNAALVLINDNDFGIESPKSTGRAISTGQRSYLLWFE